MNKKKEKETRAKLYIREVIADRVKTQFNDPKVEIDWNFFKLFENVFTSIIMNCASGAITLSKNDINDLFQLIYVHPGMKFWTQDTKNIYKAIIKSGMNDYLYKV